MLISLKEGQTQMVLVTLKLMFKDTLHTILGTRLKSPRAFYLVDPRLKSFDALPTPVVCDRCE